MNGRIWYCVNKIGMATACNDEQDALETAAEAEKEMTEHITVTAELDALRTENARLRAELEAVGAGGVQPLRAQAGWALVPVEPTREMVEAAFDALPNSPLEGNIRRHYRAMLAAAPKAPQQAAPAQEGGEA